MAQIMNTNIASSNARRNLNQSQQAMQKTLQHIASGFKINMAKDNAASFAISERMTSQISGFNQAIRNANDGVSMAQVGESSLESVSNNVQRLRELAVQSANGTLNSSDRQAIQSEANYLREEITRVTDSAEFNGQKLFDGSVDSLDFQVGPNAGDTLSVSLGEFNLGDSLASIDLSTQEGAQSAISALDDALDSVSNTRSDLGSVQNRFESTIDNLSRSAEQAEAARSRIRDSDFAAEVSDLAKQQILEQAGLAVLGQANAMPQSALSLLQNR